MIVRGVSDRHEPHRGSNSFDREAGFTASYTETLLMTQAGIEAMSKVRAP
jgi:hypothetical protein